MLYSEERKSKIVVFVQQNARASVQELSHYLDVSESTIRRDLKELEDEKLLRRTHGGAVSLQSVNFEPTYSEKEDKLLLEKEAIAKKAAELIAEKDTILLDSGTTTFQLARQLKAFTKLTVVTNSMLIAQELEDHPAIEIVLVGGTLRKETLALVGPIADQAFNLIRVDKAFVGTNALDLEEGLTTPNLIEAATKRKMIQTAKQVILLTDHSKVGKVTFAKVADLNEIDVCIIDDGVDMAVVNELENRKVNVCVVHP